MNKPPIIIAEVKTKSPFGFANDSRSQEELFELADEYGDWISVHTSERWGGKFKNISDAKKRTDKPILAKGIHETDEDILRVLDEGADYVLTVRNQPPEIEGREEWLLFEPYTLHDLYQTRALGIKAVWNARDLNNEGKPKTVGYSAARKVLPEGWLAQASLLKTWDDVDPSADAVLVGQQLESFVQTIPRKVRAYDL